MSDFNPEAILSASDQQLNEWAAEKVMGRHRGELLYNPVANIAQAIALLEHLRETREIDWELNTFSKNKSYVAEVWWNEITQYTSHGSDSLPRAITIAALLAVAEIQ